MYCLFVLTAVFVTCTTAFQNVAFIPSAEEIGIAEEFPQTFRLPNNTRPETYDIRIRTWIHNGNETFTGHVRIGIIVVESTDFITLHHNVESIESVRVLSVDGVPIDLGDYSYNSEYELFTIPVAGNNLTEGERYFIEINYIGSMNTYSGFYRYYYNIDGVERWFGSTQFEPTNARRAFPCYDEPALKSNFTIQITHDAAYSAISNMPTVGDTPANPDGSVTTAFQTTTTMSTFLVAFHVSDFTYVTNSTPQRTPQRLFSRPNAIKETDLALEAGELLLETLSEYIGIDYSLPKLDQVGVPGFPSGAMENWGLKTYPEYYFLFNETSDFFTRPINVVLTIAHELAHQWVGNLVTPSWWTYLWMKEGAATFFEYLAVDLAYPDWDMMDFFVVDVIHYVFIYDGYEFSQPMTNYVENPYEIEDQFNYIAYDKAGSVLRMFYFMFGEETFMRGLNIYLQANAYSDAAEEQLFEAMALSVELEDEYIIPPTVNVSTIMASWTRQGGFPLVTVERNYDRQTDQVTLKQERYYSYYTPEFPANTTWWVPYNFATPRNSGFENTRVEGWIPQNNFSIEIVVDSLGADDYLLMNKRAAGYYRILYDERNYRLISDAILRNSSQFHTTNIAQLLNDVNDFTHTDRLSYRPFLDLMRVLEFDTNYVSWNPVFLVIWNLNINLRGHQNYTIWIDFVRSLTEELYDTIGIEDIPNEPILRKFARESVIQLACQAGSVHCRSDATRQLRNHMDTGREFHHNIRHVMLCAALRSGNRNDFHFVWRRMMSYPVEDSGSRSELITAMGCSASRQLLNEFLRSSLNSTNENNVIYSPYEANSVLNAIIGNAGPVGLDVILDFLIENAIEAFETYGLYVVFDLANVVSRADHIERYRTFQNILFAAGLIGQEDVDYNEDRIAASVLWLSTHGSVINAWLMENYV